jgi:hypothetical protein
MPDKTCKTCKCWEKSWRGDGECGLISSVAGDNLPQPARFRVEIEVSDDHNLDWTFRTGPDFGCIHHVPTES